MCFFSYALNIEDHVTYVKGIITLAWKEATEMVKGTDE